MKFNFNLMSTNQRRERTAAQAKPRALPVWNTTQATP